MEVTGFTIAKTGFVTWTAFLVAPSGYSWRKGAISVSRIGRRRTITAIRREMDRWNAQVKAEKP